ncbi:alcohol dehydrogenase catalytic domain-containing protein [Microbacterium radiodurans]|uniref:Alcohol dehydrogenase catalytic domain-containing protein n=1 Tax=Microbacterium radiodurans TaxID=661398 RepID=A0A5J5ITJ4_9MICO|nr:alcohol dehydrogenase catalytic domain-containing protein [Microbacterium radiodurans]KAA9086644.1 alcohol dehydrogenase catalytic domain-containing protein [Microbacterium radiodurans]
MAVPTPARSRAAAVVSAARSEVLLRPAAIARAWMGPGRPHETIAVPGVSLAPGEVLLRVELATVAEEDVAAHDGGASPPMPTVLGSEFVGRVAAVGAPAPAVDGRALELGERVVSGAGPRERIAAHRELVGAFATHVHLGADVPIVRVGETLAACLLAPAAGAIARAVAVARELDEAVELAGSRVSVAGDGLAALALVAMAADRGAIVDAASADARTRTLAVRFGASSVRSGEPSATVSATAVAGGPRGVVTAHAATAPAVPTHDDLREAVAFVRNPATRRFPFADVVAPPLPLARLDEAIDLARRRPDLRVAVAP